MNTDLILKEEDTKLLMKLTSISGNVDFDKVRSSILLAQFVDIRRILTQPLYYKIMTDVKNDSLAGDYLKIYDEHITVLTTYFAAAQFISQNVIVLNNGGNFHYNPTNGQYVDYKENDRLVHKYNALGASEELRFEKFMKSINIPEYKSNCTTKNNTYKFPWIL